MALSRCSLWCVLALRFAISLIGGPQAVHLSAISQPLLSLPFLLQMEPPADGTRSVSVVNQARFSPVSLYGHSPGPQVVRGVS